MSHYLFKDRDGQTPLPPELFKGLKPRHIQTMGELDEYEEQNIAEGVSWLTTQKDQGTNYKFWLKLHKRLFKNVWTWAGKIRNHELQNQDFHPPHQIWSELKKLEDDLAYWLKEMPFSNKELLARYHERIETIHPFANGNGRFGRIIVEHLSQRQGWVTPTWGAHLKDKPAERRKQYIAALITARKEAAYEPLVNLMIS